ncbi:MAG TPA: hypothetical protein VGP96_13335, partial [Candidatus Dormibacteraeota bacterium]|nr:hypothetical protein [Candidatus Dormibacteraeota bacterium]
MSDRPHYIERPQLTPLTGDDSLTLNGEPLRGSEIHKFWRWAFSSPNSNTLRGDLMEWAVAHLLKIPPVGRVDWAEYDLLHGAKRIQVKQSSYLQGWDQRRVGKPRFGGLFVTAWDPDTNRLLERGYHCDWYVFALLESTDAKLWNPLALEQWCFYVVPRSTLMKHCFKSVGISTLNRLAGNKEADKLTAAEFGERGRAIMGLE